MKVDLNNPTQTTPPARWQQHSVSIALLEACGSVDIPGEVSRQAFAASPRRFHSARPYSPD